MGGDSNEPRIRRLLVVAYYFPPRSGGGVQRTAKFVRYLPEFGWLPTVLTIAPSFYGDNLDLSHVNDFPDAVEVIRTRAARSVTYSSRLLRFTFGLGRMCFSSATRRMRKARWFAGRKRPGSDRFHPKGAILWLFHAVRAGLRAHRRRRFELIYATGEPYSDFLVAWMLSLLTRTPFVLDMRDPWTLDPYEGELGSKVGQFVQGLGEHRTLSACSACIFANQSIDRYAEVFPKWRHKFHYIPNGYDAADFDNIAPKQFEKFTIVHNGSFLPGYRTADKFLLALRDLLKANPELRQRMQVLFVGKIGQEEQLVRDLSLDGVVQHIGYVPHRRSIEYLRGADLLLLVGGRHRWEETAKLYEYLASGKPILASLRLDGAAANLLRRHSSARIVDRESVLETTAALAEAVLQGRVVQALSNREQADQIKQWERRLLTQKLAHILDVASASQGRV
jgi:glycosyltransferase involved in cell wall biosynthesis